MSGNFTCALVFGCFQQDLWKAAFPVGIEVYYSEESIWLQHLLSPLIFFARGCQIVMAVAIF